MFERRRYRKLALPVVLVAIGCNRAPSGGSGTAPDEGEQRSSSTGGASNAPGVPMGRCVFGPSTGYAASNQPVSVAAVDLSHSGHFDLVVGERDSVGASAEFFANAGNGSFAASAGRVANGIDPATLVAADFNGDGKIDLASAPNGNIGLDLATDDGFSPNLLSFSSGDTNGQLVVGDFNHDGNPDLAFAGFDVALPTLSGAAPSSTPMDFALKVFLNAGNGGFQQDKMYPSPAPPIDAATGDFDGDGNIDIAELDSAMSGGLDVFFNAGNGTFRSPITLDATAGWAALGLAVADLNGDGKADAATTTVTANGSASSPLLEIFTGESGTTVTGPTVDTIGQMPSVQKIVAGDFNGDGTIDLAMIMVPGGAAPMGPTPLCVFQNEGGGHFGGPLVYPVGDANASIASDLAAGDFNGDGATDIAVTTMGPSEQSAFALNVLLSECH